MTVAGAQSLALRLQSRARTWPEMAPEARPRLLLGGLTALATVLAAAWVVHASRSTLDALGPAAAALGLVVMLAGRQVAACVMLASLPFAEISIGTDTSLVRYVLIGAFGAWFADAILRGADDWLRFDGTDALVAVWAVGSIVSAAFLDPSQVGSFTVTYLNLVLVYFVTSRSVRNADQARAAVLALSVGVAAIGLLTLADPGLASGVTVTGDVVRLGPIGTTGAAGINRFAAWLAVGAVLPWLALREPRRISTLAARAGSLFSVAALVATASKGALIAVGAGLLAYALLVPRGARLPRLVLTLMLLAGGWLALPAGVHQRFAAFLQPGSDAYSRFALWDAGWRMFLAHPLTGVGLGNFQMYASAYFPQGTIYAQDQASHNIIVGALAETGIVGAAVLIAMIGALVGQGLSMVRADRVLAGRRADLAMAQVTAGLMTGYLVFLIVSMSVDLQRDRFFVALAGLVHGLYRARAHAGR